MNGAIVTMKILCFSDTHRCIDGLVIPKVDVVVCAGDFCNTGSLEDVSVFNRWFSRLPVTHKILVAGNHDICFERDPALARSCLDKNIIYLQDEGIEIGNIKFYGSPWQLPFMNWAFNLPEDGLRKNFERIPENVDVLITHSPPYGILDSVKGKNHLGSKSLLERVKKVKPRYHVFGHIHDSYGKNNDKATRTTFLNCSLLDESYRFVNKPIVIEIT